ncbi:MAG TPA: FkbM family methyltransferase [Candidatus Dormibacteraeota bacterium]|nr:FkbM family methyltransferase [Candidatus Dormibacteraeota bacterium]
MDRIEVGSTVRALRGRLRNWWWVGPVSYAVMLSPAKRLLEGSRLARRRITLRFRDGRTLRCAINDMQAFVEVFLLDDYEIDGLDGESVRTVVDAGANVGTATLWFAERFPRARIYSVEPGPATRLLLEENVAANRLGDRVVVVGSALGAGRGVGRFVEGEASILGRVVGEPAEGSAGGGPAVDVRGLGDLFDDLGLGTVDVLKVDCEGAEYDILLSAPGSALRSVRTITAEYHPAPSHDADEIAARLRGEGFAVRVQPHPTLPRFGNLVATRAASG